MSKHNTFFSIYILIVLFVFFGIACGSDSGQSSNAQVTVLSPLDDSSFARGGVVRYEIATTNFSLVPPFDRRVALRHGDVPEDSHGSESNHDDSSSHGESSSDEGTDHEVTEHEASNDSSHEMDEVLEEEESSAHEDEHLEEDSHSNSDDSHEHGDDESDHSHDSSAVNPAATEGHYHLYLDEASGTDPHITAWSYEGEYQLPDDISPGTHSLRFELRDNNHTRIGTAGAEAVIFFEVE